MYWALTMSQAELMSKLFEACKNEDDEQVRRLVALEGAPSFILSEQAKVITPLHLVCKLGNLKILIPTILCYSTVL